MDFRWQTATLEFSDGAQQTIRDDGEFGLSPLQRTRAAPRSRSKTPEENPCIVWLERRWNCDRLRKPE